MFHAPLNGGFEYGTPEKSTKNFGILHMLPIVLYTFIGLTTEKWAFVS